MTLDTKAARARTKTALQWRAARRLLDGSSTDDLLSDLSAALDALDSAATKYAEYRKLCREHHAADDSELACLRASNAELAAALDEIDRHCIEDADEDGRIRIAGVRLRIRAALDSARATGG